MQENDWKNGKIQEKNENKRISSKRTRWKMKTE